VIDNTDLFSVMTRALGITYENPLMSPDDALRLSAAPQPTESDRPHWV
jgi:hypothetical protein